MGGYVGQMSSRIRVELNTLSEPQDRTHSSRATLCQERTLLSPPSPRAASFSKLMLRGTRMNWSQPDTTERLTVNGRTPYRRSSVIHCSGIKVSYPLAVNMYNSFSVAYSNRSKDIPNILSSLFKFKG